MRIGIVNYDGVYLHNKPDIDADVVGQVKKGDEVNILDTVRDYYKMIWYRIEDSRGVRYIKSDFVDV